MRYTKQDVLEIYARHTDWLQGKGGKKAVFDNCTLEDLDLSDLTFDQAEFINCRIQDVKMPESLVKAKFSKCTLITADFEDCDLTKVKFTEGSFLSNNFKDCYSPGIKFKKVRIRRCTFTGMSLKKSGLRIYHGGFWEAYIGAEATSIGCRYYLNKEWKSFTDDQIESMSELALDYWNENKAIIFMLMDSFKVKS